MSYFINNAMAQVTPTTSGQTTTTTSQPQSGGLQGLLGGGAFGPVGMMLVFFFIFYFIVIRPQQKQQKKLKQMVNEAKRGDEVVLAGGIHGRISEIKDNTVMIQIANNVIIKVERASITIVKGWDQAKKPDAEKKAA